jgi:hypothetical protein
MAQGEVYRTELESLPLLKACPSLSTGYANVTPSSSSRSYARQGPLSTTRKVRLKLERRRWSVKAFRQ